MITYYPQLASDLRKIRNDPTKFKHELLKKRNRNGDDSGGIDEGASSRSEAIRTRLSTMTTFFDKRNTPTPHALELIAKWRRSFDAYEKSGWNRSAIFDGSDCLHCVSRILSIKNRSAFFDCEKCPGFYITDSQIVEQQTTTIDTEKAFDILATCSNVDIFREKCMAAGATVSECFHILDELKDRYTITPYLYPEAELKIK